MAAKTSWRVNGAGHVMLMEGKGNELRVLVIKSEGKITVTRNEYRHLTSPL
jgi:hypothetical protein